MSKISALGSALEQLEKAEYALLEASRAFPVNSSVRDFLTNRADSISRITDVIQNTYLPQIEKTLILSATIKSSEDQEPTQ